MTGFFVEDELLTVSVIRSASDQHYPEEATIPIPDRWPTMCLPPMRSGSPRS